MGMLQDFLFKDQAKDLSFFSEQNRKRNQRERFQGKLCSYSQTVTKPRPDAVAWLYILE